VDELDAELQLLTRHLSGISTPEEEARLRDWLAADPAHPRLLDALGEAWDLSSTLPPLPYDPDSAWTRVVHRVQSPRSGRDDGVKATSARAPRRRGPVRSGSAARRGAWRAAAATLLVIGCGFLWKSLHHAPAASEAAALEIEVPRGQEARLRLPDGSHVVLAPESKLRYPRSFGDHSRALYLEGMAYFEVVHDPDRPFVVHAGEGIARVLGTRFVVRAYPDVPRVEVAVTQGKVSLRADSIPPNRAVAFTPGQVGQLDPDGVVRHERDTSAKVLLGWMNGHPIIHDLPLSDALAEIERWYDVQLSVGDPQLASRRITTSIERSSLDETLTVIALALDARYVAHGDTLVFLHDH
jgi:transmembrane sensor